MSATTVDKLAEILQLPPDRITQDLLDVVTALQEKLKRERSDSDRKELIASMMETRERIRQTFASRPYVKCVIHFFYRKKRKEVMESTKKFVVKSEDLQRLLLDARLPGDVAFSLYCFKTGSRVVVNDFQAYMPLDLDIFRDWIRQDARHERGNPLEDVADCPRHLMTVLMQYLKTEVELPADEPVFEITVDADSSHWTWDDALDYLRTRALWARSKVEYHQEATQDDEPTGKKQKK